MTRYVCAIGASWGLAVAQQVTHGEREWGWVFTPELLAEALAERPRYVFFLNWSHRVPEVVTSTYECVNFHCTPLPYGRGGHPIENMILRGHTGTLITAHRMTADLDAGPIYGQRNSGSGAISLAGTKEDILQRFVEPCVALIHEIVVMEPTSVPQTGAVVSFQRLSPEAYTQFWEARG